MSRRRGRLAVGALALGAAAVFAGCSTSTQPEPSPSTGTSTTAPDQNAPDAEMATVVGPGLTLRSGGSFGQDMLTFRRAEKIPFQVYVEVKYPANSASRLAAKSDGTTAGGAQSYWLLDSGSLDSAYLRYWVWFPDGFDWVKGGKLPGLFGGTTTSGQRIPDGTDGFSTRYMWRADGAGEVYAYLPTSKEHGTSLGRGDWTWPTGHWTCVEQRVVLNTPGQANGTVTVWLDGRQVLESNGLTFRTSPALRIDGLFFSTFFGGGDESWATPTDQTVRFGGFQIHPTRVGCDRDRGTS